MMVCTHVCDGWTVGNVTAATHADGIPTDQNGSPNALILNPAVLKLITSTATNPRLGTGADIWTITFTGGGKESEAEKQTALDFMNQVQGATGDPQSKCTDCTCQKLTAAGTLSPCQPC